MADQDIDDGLESWQNTTQSTFYIKVRGSSGQMESSQVPPGRPFHIAPRDRRINQMEAASTDIDPFSNGNFAVLSVVETEADAAAIKDNPAQITDTQMVELYRRPFKELDKRLRTITNPVTLRRMAAIGHDPGTEAAQAKVAAVEKRLAEVDDRPAGSKQTKAAAGAPSAGAPEPQEASFYSDLGPAPASLT